MSAELAILNKARNKSGNMEVIWDIDYDEETMLDISNKFFGREEVIPNIANSTYENKYNLGISSPADGVCFGNDGLYYYMACGGYIFMYILTIPYDISSGPTSPNSQFAGGGDARGISIDPTGTKFYISVWNGGIRQYNFYYGAWTIGNLSHSSTVINYSGVTIDSYDVGRGQHYMSTDGTRLWTFRGDTALTEWSFGTAFDITSLSIVQNYTNFSKNGADYAMTFNESGTMCFMGRWRWLYQFNLVTPFDIGTMSPTGWRLNFDTAVPANVGFNTIVLTPESDDNKLVLGIQTNYTTSYVFDTSLVHKDEIPTLVNNPNDSYKIVITRNTII